MPEAIPMTQEGYDKLQREIAELEKRRPGIKQQIQEAREKGDLRENADYHAAREELAMLEAKLAYLRGQLANAVIVDPSKIPTDRVTLGHTVVFQRLDDGKTLTRTLVGAGQADAASGKILPTSPIGKALIGAAVGDTVVAELPSGPIKLRILEIRLGE